MRSWAVGLAGRSRPGGKSGVRVWARSDLLANKVAMLAGERTSVRRASSRSQPDEICLHRWESSSRTVISAALRQPARASPFGNQPGHLLLASSSSGGGGRGRGRDSWFRLRGRCGRSSCGSRGACRSRQGAGTESVGYQHASVCQLARYAQRHSHIVWVLHETVEIDHVSTVVRRGYSLEPELRWLGDDGELTMRAAWQTYKFLSVRAVEGQNVGPARLVL